MTSQNHPSFRIPSPIWIELSEEEILADLTYPACTVRPERVRRGSER